MLIKNILIVDDDELNCEIVDIYLRMAFEMTALKYNIVSATSAKQALKMLKKYNFDCILTDIMMPEMDGFELMKYIFSDNNYQNIPIIVVSALLEGEPKSIALGAKLFIGKPFDPKEFNAVLNWIEKSQ